MEIAENKVLEPLMEDRVCHKCHREIHDVACQMYGFWFHEPCLQQGLREDQVKEERLNLIRNSVPQRSVVKEALVAPLSIRADMGLSFKRTSARSGCVEAG